MAPPVVVGHAQLHMQGQFHDDDVSVAYELLYGYACQKAHVLQGEGGKRGREGRGQRR